MDWWDAGVGQPRPLHDESSSSNHAEAVEASATPAPPSDGELASAVFKAQDALLAAWDAAQAAGLSVQHYAADSNSPWPHVYSIQRMFTPDNARIQQEDRPEWPRDHEPAGRYGVVGKARQSLTGEITFPVNPQPAAVPAVTLEESASALGRDAWRRGQCGDSPLSGKGYPATDILEYAIRGSRNAGMSGSQNPDSGMAESDRFVSGLQACADEKRAAFRALSMTQAYRQAMAKATEAVRREAYDRSVDRLTAEEPGATS